MIKPSPVISAGFLSPFPEKWKHHSIKVIKFTRRAWAQKPHHRQVVKPAAEQTPVASCAETQATGRLNHLLQHSRASLPLCTRYQGLPTPLPTGAPWAYRPKHQRKTELRKCWDVNRYKGLLASTYPPLFSILPGLRPMSSRHTLVHLSRDVVRAVP